MHGDLAQLQECLDKIDTVQAQVNAKRAKDAANAAYEASQAAAQSIQHEPVTMDIDQTEATESKKRKHGEQDGETADVKKTRTGMTA